MDTPTSPLTSPISELVWETKYRYSESEALRDRTMQDTWRRVAHALASVEPHQRDVWEQRFYGVLEGFRFLPGGRILAGAGTGHRVTLFNCFVMGLIEDSMDGIFSALKEGALTMQQGGGVGYDFSTLRPEGSRAERTHNIASGPISFMRIWDTTCSTLLSTGNRRGAMMATLRCDHPDIESFIDAKQDANALRHFNLSVLVTDDFMQAVRENKEWPLTFPEASLDETSARGLGSVLRRWSGSEVPVPCRVLRITRARALWEQLMHATYDYAEPGVLFVDRINQTNNLWYCEHISATNPCGELPLPPYGACDLGSINLTCFVEKPFTAGARLDLDGIEHTARTATRMLDNVIDLSRFPLRKQRIQARHTRRIGLGITGLADALIMLGLRYGDEESYRMASRVMQSICYAAYHTSVQLAAEKGAFPAFASNSFLQSPFIRSLPEALQTGIAESGIRNSHLIAIAPTGTISLLANNVSSGLEPVFDLHYTRRVLTSKGRHEEIELENFAWRMWRELKGRKALLPNTFVTSRALEPQTHLKMQAALQPYVDNAISKTINVPVDLEFSEFRSLYEDAYSLGLKGCTTFRPNPVSGSVLSAQDTEDYIARCCVV